jgi:uncharacterized protein YndB with AHSA1/START domain
MSSTDRIERDVLVSAPRERVWAAVGDSAEFGTWFKCVFDGPFEPGATLTATLHEPGWEGTEFPVFVEGVDAGRHLSFRWNPGEVDPDGDYTDRPTTLVSFDLEDAPEGTRLRIVESGFDALPAEVARDARKRNAHGWDEQARRVTAHVAKVA